MINVLLVDDSSGMRTIVRKFVEQFDPAINFLEANHGNEALQIIQESAISDNPIHLVILDWMMPEMTGAEFLEELRAVEQWAKDPAVIMLTAESYPEQAKAIMKYNVDAYLLKPFTKQQVIDAVARVYATRGWEVAGGRHAV